MYHFFARPAVTLFCTGWLALFFIPALYGQTGLQLSDSSQFQLKEVVVQATRANENSPVPHSNFSAAVLNRQYHAQDVPFLLSSVPSLVETSDGGAGVGYTGLRIRGSDPTRINVTINGIPFNDTESQGVFWVDLPDLASSAAEIQVQRGVGTSTNGAGAFGASVNLDLSKIEPERFARISNTIGSFGTRKHSVMVGTGLLDNKWSFSARVSSIHADGYVDRASADLNSVHLSGAYLDQRQSFQIQVLSGREITYQAWNGLPAQYLEVPELRTYNSAGTERPGSSHPDEVDNYTQRHYLAHYKRELASGLHLQLNGHYTQGFGYYEQYKADQEMGNYGLPLNPLIDTLLAPMDLIRRRWLDNDFYGGTFALRWLPGNAWKTSFLLGGAWSKYEGRHFGELIWTESFAGVYNDYRYYENEANKRDANIFLKLETSPFSRFTSFIDVQFRGIQYDFLGFDNELKHVQQQSTLSFFNPKIGATYDLPANWTAFAFLGVGHREPNRDDYTQSTPASRPKPERLLDVEAGIRGKAKSWSLATNFFWMRYQDQLVLDGRLNDVGAYIRTNVPDSWRTGFELEASAVLDPIFTLSGSASISQNKIRSFQEYQDNWDTGAQEILVHENTDLAFSPNFIARGEGMLRVFKRNAHTLTTSLIGKYVSKQYLDNTSNAQTQLPGYFVSELRLNYDLSQWVGKELNFMLSVNNLLDKKYASNGWAYRYVSASYDARPYDAYTRREAGDVYHQAGFFPQAGRNWMATLRLAF